MSPPAGAGRGHGERLPGGAGDPSVRDGDAVGEPVGACRLSRAVPGCALPARGSRGLPLGVAPPPLCSAREPGGSRGRWGQAGGSERSPQVPGSSPRGTPDPLSGCAGTVPVGFVARLLIECSGRFLFWRIALAVWNGLVSLKKGESVSRCAADVPFCYWETSLQVNPSGFGKQ